VVDAMFSRPANIQQAKEARLSETKKPGETAGPLAERNSSSLAAKEELYLENLRFEQMIRMIFRSLPRAISLQPSAISTRNLVLTADS
jgi:hypothetical protein